MAGKLLDTNAVVALQARDPAMLHYLADNEILIPSTVIAELYYGAYKSGHVEANLKTVEEFADNNTVLECDKITAKFWGQIREQLRRKGRPIPENDIWIAAVAQQYGLTLVTRDEHFKHVSGLSLEMW